MSNIAITELESESTQLKDNDYILVSNDNGNGSYTSMKMKGSVVKAGTTGTCLFTEDKVKNAVTSYGAAKTSDLSSLAKSSELSNLATKTDISDNCISKVAKFKCKFGTDYIHPTYVELSNVKTVIGYSDDYTLLEFPCRIGTVKFDTDLKGVDGNFTFDQLNNKVFNVSITSSSFIITLDHTKNTVDFYAYIRKSDGTLLARIGDYNYNNPAVSLHRSLYSDLNIDMQWTQSSTSNQATKFIINSLLSSSDYTIDFYAHAFDGATGQTTQFLGNCGTVFTLKKSDDTIISTVSPDDIDNPTGKLYAWKIGTLKSNGTFIKADTYTELLPAT